MMAQRRDLEMSLGREEFLRLLPGLGPAREVGEGVFQGGAGEGRWEIRLVPLPDFRAGRMVLPRYRVEIRLETRSPEAAEAFMARFHRAFQRGGG